VLLALLLLARGDLLGPALAQEPLPIQEDPIAEAELQVAAIEEAQGETPDLAQALSILGNRLFARGQVDEARPHLERAVAIREKALGPGHPLTVDSINNLAVILCSQGNYEEAQPLLERALRVTEETFGEDHEMTATSLNNLGHVLATQGLFEEARPLMERALRIHERVLGKDHPETATNLGNLATILWRTGHYEKARPLYERALAITEKALGDHPATAESLNNLANLLQSMGHSEEARPLHERALAIREETLGGEHPETAASLANLATLLGDQGLWKDALPLQERALAIRQEALGRNHPITAESLLSVSYCLAAAGRVAEALPLCQRAISVFERTLGPEHPLTAHGLDILSRILVQMGLREESRAVLERVLAIRSKVLGPDHPDTSTSLNNLACHLADMGLLSEARPMVEQTLEIKERTLGKEHPDTTASLCNLALLEWDLGLLDAALEHARGTMAATEAHVERSLLGLTESERLRSAGELQGRLSVFLGLSRCVASKGHEKESYERLLAWKGRISRSLLAGDPRSSGLVTREEEELLSSLRATQKRLSDELYRSDVADREAHELMLEELRDRRNDLELRLVRIQGTRSRPLAREENEPSGGNAVDDIAGSLPEGAAVIDFYVHPDYRPAESGEGTVITPGCWSSPRLTVWILKGGEVHEIDLGEASIVEEATRAFLAELVSHRAASRLSTVSEDGGREPTTSAGGRLRGLLWDPLREAIGAASLVFVSPDTFLGTLPFETLQLEDGTFLVERHGFVYLQDMTSLPRLALREHPKEQTPSLLLAGGIDYRGREGIPEGLIARGKGGDRSRGTFRSTWRPLSATRDEVDAIADIHDEAFGDDARRDTLTRRAATEERIKADLPGARYVHLATHGYFQPEGLPSMWQEIKDERGSARLGLREVEARVAGLLPGLLSGLVLAGANAEPEPGRDNGLLTAEEVTFVDLSGCELVVLSACETGLGQPASGEGMIGLRRSFRQAGARTVVSSLWSVKDEATSELMASFYENLWLSDLGKLEALRRAQLRMLEANRREYGEGLPSTWGAFVLDGDWR